MTMNTTEKEKWYAYFNKKYGFPIEGMKKVYEDELSGKIPMDAPLEVPDKMEVNFRYSYGGQSRFFRELRDNKKLYGAKCTECGKVYCPPRANCSLCYKPTEWVPLKGTGVIKAFTIQYQSTSAFIKKTPFICGYVQVDGSDFLLMANMEANDVKKVKVGTKVEVIFRDERHGLITDFYFRPIEE